jgi:hypothetical protein
MVGGVRKEARSSDVRIYRQKPGLPETETIKVDLAQIKKNQRNDIILQPYDIIEVPEAGIFSPSRLGQTMLSTLSGGLSTMGSALPTRVIY